LRSSFNQRSVRSHNASNSCSCPSVAWTRLGSNSSCQRSWMYANVGCFFLLASGFGSSMVMTLLLALHACGFLYDLVYGVTTLLSRENQNGQGIRKTESRYLQQIFLRPHRSRSLSGT